MTISDINLSLDDKYYLDLMKTMTKMQHVTKVLKQVKVNQVIFILLAMVAEHSQDHDQSVLRVSHSSQYQQALRAKLA